MLEILKFVQGAVSRKDFIPAMSHFQIANHTIRSFNGVVTISSPIECDLNCNPRAEQMVKAISKCNDYTTLTLTANGNLSVKSKNVRVTVNCTTESLSTPLPSGKFYKINGKVLYDAFEKVYDIIGEDATRVWANGALIVGNYVYATNNVILVRVQLDSTPIDVPVNIPKSTVKEILRIKEHCDYLQLDKNCITFHYGKDKWLRSTLLDLGWPNAAQLIPNDYSLCTELPDDFFKQLDNVKDFLDDHERVFLFENTISTRNILAEGTGEQSGCDLYVQGLQARGVYRHSMLTKLKGILTHIHFNDTHKCPFYGEGITGLIVGMKE